MTDRAEIERLLNQTGRTLEGLPTQDEYRERDLRAICEAMRSSHIYETFPFINYQSDVIELLVGALRDALDKQPKWISVKDMLPENFKTVIILRDDMPNGGLSDIGWRIGEYWSVPNGVNVTHWMPLPEPPEGDA